MKLSLTNSAKRAIIKVITNTVIINKKTKNKGVRKNENRKQLQHERKGTF